MRAITKAIRAEAQHIVELTLDEARQQPNMLGAIMPTHLKRDGFYTCTIAGTKTLFLLKGGYR